MKKISMLLIYLEGIVVGTILGLRIQKRYVKKWKDLSNKNRALFLLMDQWVRIGQENKKIKEYFLRYKFYKIAIYGMSYVGLRLTKELKGSEIRIMYGIDRDAANILSDVSIFTLNDSLPDVDAIVVTAIGGFDEINDRLSRKVCCPVIAIEDILNEI